MTADVTSITALVVAITTLVSAIGGIVVLLRKATATHVVATRTEKLVNNQLDRRMDRNDELVRTLTAAGIEVPPESQTAVEASAEAEKHQ